ncbi:MAG: hypothetical protein GY738_11880 [Pseudoalteromonas sp.]|nr:hypothetical protein [Pseudoalteromonas sp.]
MSHYLVIEHTANTYTVKFSDEYIANVWRSLCEPHSKPLSYKAVRAMISLSYDHHTDNVFGSDVANELSEPFSLSNPCAAIYPEEFQPWESQDDSIAEWVDGTLILTWEGSILKDKLVDALDSAFTSIAKREKEITLYDSYC